MAVEGSKKRFENQQELYDFAYDTPIVINEEGNIDTNNNANLVASVIVPYNFINTVKSPEKYYRANTVWEELLQGLS